jgi:transcriptional regulator GlxA family with amidase domain
MVGASVEQLRVNGTFASQKMAERAVKRIGIVLFEGFSLLGAGTVAEAFHRANDIAASDGVQAPYNVWLLSAEGGSIPCSSSLRVCTDGFDALHFAGFDGLYIAGGQGARSAVRDERLIDWLRRVYPASEVVSPIGEGHLLLRAAGVALRPEPLRTHPAGPLRADEVSADSDDRYETLKSALMLIKRDLGPSVVRAVAERLLPIVGGKLAPLFVDSAPATVGDKMRSLARWLRENCERAIFVADAAQAVAMSERNFLRRFKLEMGVTPSEYLLQARLEMTCWLLADTELPVGKIARCCGMVDGDYLARIFRKRLGLSPTEYRNRGGPTSLELRRFTAHVAAR